METGPSIEESTYTSILHPPEYHTVRKFPSVKICQLTLNLGIVMLIPPTHLVLLEITQFPPHNLEIRSTGMIDEPR